MGEPVGTDRQRCVTTEERMDVNDLKGLFAEVKKRMDGADRARPRASSAACAPGRASVNILDTVHVEAYGSMMPLNQVASLSIPEPTLIVAQPFDPSLMGAIEKAIRSSNLGLNPTNDGKVIRIPIPPLTEERRKELSKLVHKLRRGRPQRRPPGPPRRQRPAEEAAQGPQDLAKTTSGAASTRCRRSPTSTSADRRDAEEEGRGAAGQVDCDCSIGDCRLTSSIVNRQSANRQSQSQFPMSYFTHLECSVPCGAGPYDPRVEQHLCTLRRAPARPLRPRRGARAGSASRSPAASRTCGGIAS